MNTMMKSLVLLPSLFLLSVILGSGFQYSGAETNLTETLSENNKTLVKPGNGVLRPYPESLNQTSNISFQSGNGTLALSGEPVTTILARIVTHDINNAGTDAHVYLGIGGREFYIDSDSEFNTDYDDFERGDDRTYTLGDWVFSDTHPVLKPGNNDPRAPYALNFATLDKFPVYIRTEPNEFDNAPDWALKLANVQAYGPTDFRNYRTPQNDDDYFELGQYIGEAAYLLCNGNCPDNSTRPN